MRIPDIVRFWTIYGIRTISGPLSVLLPCLLYDDDGSSASNEMTNNDIDINLTISHHKKALNFIKLE